jgi:beta-fructofuranosidase
MPSRRTFLKSLAALAAAPKPFQFPPSISPSLANDPLRPQFHLLPARNWMNDPDGPIFFNGRYHMFFQYNPNAAVWGNMHWAHAVSQDMLHWQHLPVALAPTPDGPDADGCFTGSAILHDGVPTLLYTGVRSVSPGEATLRDGQHNFLETQCLATSRDAHLRTWQKHATQVLLPPRDPKLTGFRDPCLWQDSHDKDFWYMGVGSGQRGIGGQVLLYRSSDLLTWEYLHPLAQGESASGNHPDPVDAGDMWECPDFFPLNGKHALLYSTQRKVFWEVGEYDAKEHRFHPQERGLLDHGAFYAPKSQLDAQGRRILWGWIPETRPESEYSAAGWAGCMSLPRVLAINENNELTMSVVPEAVALETTRQKWNPAERRSPARPRKDSGTSELSIPDACAKIELVFSDKPFRVAFNDGASDILQISYDPSINGRELQINSASAALALRPANDHRLAIYLDASIIECFADDTLALTTRVYRAPCSPLRVTASDAGFSALRSLTTSSIKPISPDRLTS